MGEEGTEEERINREFQELDELSSPRVIVSLVDGLLPTLEARRMDTVMEESDLSRLE